MKRFDSNVLVGNQMERIEKLRDEFEKLDDLIDTIVQPNREASLAHTKLEEACMWAVKAISRE